jgi:hypothetical protein
MTNFLATIRHRLWPKPESAATEAQFDNAPEAWTRLVPSKEVPLNHEAKPASAEPEHIDFDEEWYLQRYPDVALALKEQPGSSGLAHYLLHGRQEGRLPVPPVETNNAAAGSTISISRESHKNPREWSGERID